jgi:hypothetical protein
MCFYPSPRAMPSAAVTLLSEVLLGRFFIKSTSTVHWRLWEPKVGPKTTQSAQNVQKRSPKAHFWELKASRLRAKFVRVVPCQNISRGYVFITLWRSGPFGFCSETRFGNALRTGNTFFHAFGSRFSAQVRPKAAQGRPNASKRTPKASPGTHKIHQKSTWDPTLVFKGAREVSGVPPGQKMTPESTNKS